MSDQKPAGTKEVLDFKTVLEKTPPGETRFVAGLVHAGSTALITPSIPLYCDSEECGGLRFLMTTPRARTS
jgi:hypothetical protein